jgi:hypothetical protein
MKQLYYAEEGEKLNFDDLKNRPELEIKEFDNEEVKKAFELYKGKYDLKGYLSLSAEEVCKNPLFLRIISDIYKGQEVPGDLNRINLFNLYWRRKIETGVFGKDTLLLNMINSMRNQKSVELAVPYLENQVFFNRLAFEELKDDGILEEFHDKFERKIKFVYERFYEYTFGWYLYNNRKEIISDLEGFADEIEGYESFKKGFEYFLLMLDQVSQLKT